MKRAAAGEHVHALPKRFGPRGTAHGVDHEICTDAVGEAHHGGHGVHLACVDDIVRSEVGSRFATEGHGIDCHTGGRWPPNVLLDTEAASLMDIQSGPRSGRPGKQPRAASPGDGWGMTATGAEYLDTGGASRFFPRFHYCAKASTAEREAGLTGGTPAYLALGVHRDKGSPERSNHHPTVKPVELMRWLCRLVTPPGGTVLDPFTGSGTTGMACVIEGFNFVGIDLSEEYAEIARTRIGACRRGKSEPLGAPTLPRDDRQGDLFS